ncbi:MAG: flagellar hook-length control protein FliK [Methylobacterium sp.]|nr:flagellar hook-length control protein FliK [Methylobacterium sp.]
MLQSLQAAGDGPVPADPRALIHTAIDPVHPQAAQLVNQQLQALDSRQILWQGQVWPGQEMFWEIEEEGHRGGRSGEDEAPSWHTRLNLQLPALGSISAQLALVEGALRLDISADNAHSAALMRQHQEALGSRLQESGLTLTGISVRQADETNHG